MTSKAPDELLSVLESLSPALESIDVRMVAVESPSEDHWENLATSIIISEKSLDEVQYEHKKLPVFRTNQFAIFLKALPYDYEIFDQILKGEIKLLGPYRRDRIRCRKLNLLALKVISTQERIEGRTRWILRAEDSGSEEERQKLWSVVGNQNVKAKQLGYKNINELVSKSLRTRFSDRRLRDFEILIPPLAKIESARFVGSKFEVKVCKPINLTALQLNLTLERLRGYMYGEIWKDVVIVGKGDSRPKEKSCMVKEVFELDDVRAYDRMEVELIVRASALTLDRTDRRAPLENVVEPFIKTLNSFCTLEELKTMLLEPENYGRNPETIFEIAVAWLLSLAGFSTIYLGSDIRVPRSKDSKRFRDRKFDVLVSKSGYSIGCSDIIAYEENEVILLIDCDIGPFDTKKMQRLVDTKNHFKASFGEYKQLRVIPVLFSPKDIRKQDENVKIADKWVIESMFEEVVQGNRELARSKLYY